MVSRLASKLLDWIESHWFGPAVLVLVTLLFAVLVRAA
jgi:hypothetical protein